MKRTIAASEQAENKNRVCASFFVWVPRCTLYPKQKAYQLRAAGHVLDYTGIARLEGYLHVPARTECGALSQAVGTPPWPQTFDICETVLILGACAP
jgi:hypothetical protein